MSHCRYCPFFGEHGHDSTARLAILLFFISLVSFASATEEGGISTSQPTPTAHSQTSLDIPIYLAPFVWWFSRLSSTAHLAMSTTTTFRHVVTMMWFQCRAHTLQIVLGFLCMSLMVISCVIEREPSPMRLWLAMCLAFSWLVPTSLQLHKTIRKFQPLGRVDAFIVFTAMLSFLFIKAFAILGGYNTVALLRVPPCFTLAAWIAGHWCTLDAAPEIPFGA